MNAKAKTLETSPTKSLEQILRDDHDHLDALWAGAESLRDADPARARQLFEEFVAGLEEHIGIEEDFLFPQALQRKEAGYVQLVGTMKEEHRLILAQVGLIKNSLHSGSLPEESVGTELANLLGNHNAREEGMFYPLFDGAFSEGEGKELRERVLGRCSCPDH